MYVDIHICLFEFTEYVRCLYLPFSILPSHTAKVLTPHHLSTRGDGRWGKNEKKKRFFLVFGTHSKAQAGWHTRLRLVRVIPWANFAVIIAQLWSIMTAIFSWVRTFALKYYLRPRSLDSARPMHHVKYLRASPAEMPFRNWYTANTNHFHLTDSVRWKWET